MQGGGVEEGRRRGGEGESVSARKEAERGPGFRDLSQKAVFLGGKEVKMLNSSVLHAIQDLLLSTSG